MKQIFVILFLLIGQISQAGTGFISNHYGVWYGVGVQSDDSNWDMLVTLGRARGQVSYISLNCGGWWTYQTENEESLTAIESLNYGQNACIETGDVRLVAYDDGKMLYIWCSAEEDVSAVALLSRTTTARGPDYQAALLTTNAALESIGAHIEMPFCTSPKWAGV